MTWTNRTKLASITAVTGHVCSANGTAGRALGNTVIQFTPLELYGAAARCSHMHHVDPTLATPEAALMAALIERYVDDVSGDFAILPTASNFKDYVKSFFSGTVASALAYLAMVQDGYHWADHFESVAGGNPAVGRSPDFVFTGHGGGTALVEFKGTRSAGKGAFDSTVEAGYIGQVEPHLGHSVNSVIATHGFCIGAWLTSTTKAELLVHHTNTVSAGGTIASPEDVNAGTATVQRHDYATVMTLVVGPGFGADVRRGRTR